MQFAATKGWTVHEFEIDDGCYEIEARDSEGREFEVKLNPATLEVVEMDYDDDDRRGTRKGAPAAGQQN